MIVVGGWPGRQVIGLGGRFGVRQSELASGGAEPSPFANNFDVGDDALTEMVVVVTSLPASGTVTLTDDGDFTHTGAADGTYHTLGTVYSWAPGGPLVVHVEQEDITSTFGTVAATPVGIAIESQAAQALSGRQIIGAGLALEAGVALALMPPQGVGLAIEVDVAYAAHYVRSVKPLRKTQYIPTRAPTDPSQVGVWATSEFERVLNGLEAPFTHELLDVLNEEPGRKLAGKALLCFADGTNWNPGAGRGLYLYDPLTAVWTKIS